MLSRNCRRECNVKMFALIANVVLWIVTIMATLIVGMLWVALLNGWLYV